MNHYETLGVARDATDDEIRRAYRRAASQAHPDREGGSTERMASVNQAYEVLSDTERRKRYDETGQSDAGPTLEAAARSTVLELLQAALAQPGNCIERARSTLVAKIAEVDRARQAVTQQVSKLERRRPLIKVKSGDNLAHMIIDQQLTAMRQQLKQMEAWEPVGARALEILDGHHSDEIDQGVRVNIFGGGDGFAEVLAALDEMESRAAKRRASWFGVDMATKENPKEPPKGAAPHLRDRWGRAK